MFVDQSSGQPVYYQTMMPQQQLLKGSPRAALYSRPWNIAKMALRGSDIVAAIILLGLSIDILFSYMNAFFLAMVFTLPAAVTVILWESAELITLCARGGKLGIHPGAHVAMHLIFWLYHAVGLAFFSIYIVWDISSEYSYYNYYGYENPNAGKIYAALTFFAIMLLLNFVLFVRACVETSEVNRQARSVFVVPVVPGGQQMMAAHPQHMSMAYPPQAFMYPAPMQQQQQQQMRESMYNPVADGKAPTSDASFQGQAEGSVGAPPMEYYTPGNTYGGR